MKQGTLTGSYTSRVWTVKYDADMQRNLKKGTDTTKDESRFQKKGNGSLKYLGTTNQGPLTLWFTVIHLLFRVSEMFPREYKIFPRVSFVRTFNIEPFCALKNLYLLP